MLNKLVSCIILVLGIIAIQPNCAQAQVSTDILLPSIVWNDSEDKGLILADTTKLIAIDAKGARLGIFNTSSPFYTVSLSPDGQKIVYTVNGGASAGVWLIKIGSGEVSKIASGPIGILHWSPDSSSLMFSIETFKEENGQKIWQGQTIYVADGDGKNVKQVYP